MSVTEQLICASRSQATEETIAALGAMAEVLDRTPWNRKDGSAIRAVDVYVEPMVRTRRVLSHDARRYDDRLHRQEDASPQDESMARWYEQGSERDSEERRWSQEFRRGGRVLAVKGAPGSGKSFVTAHAVAEHALKLKERLQRGETSFDDAEFPLWVTASALAASLAASDQQAVLDAIQHADKAVHLGAHLRAWLERSLRGEGGQLRRVLLVIDALDEVAQWQAFEERLRVLSGSPSVHLVITCRTLQWEGGWNKTQGWLSVGAKLEEIELVPLSPALQRRIIRQFFASDPQRANHMHGLLRRNPSFRHACTTSLLLTFACLLEAKGELTRNTTRPGLYRMMLKETLDGTWRKIDPPPPWKGHPKERERLTDSLVAIMGPMFAKTPERNRFTLSQWDLGWKGFEPLAYLWWEREGVFETMERLGLIVHAGKDRNGDECWSLAHRTFLEYLAASWLARQGMDVCVKAVREHRWFAPEWREVLTLLAGLIEDATLLVEAVDGDGERDDIFGSLLALKAQLVGAAGDNQVNERILGATCQKVLSFWEATLDWRGDAMRPWANGMLASLGSNQMAGHLLLAPLLQHLPDSTYHDREAAIALGALWDRQAVEPLLQALLDTDFSVRNLAAEALGYLGDERAVEPLLHALGDSWVRRRVAEALGSLGDMRAVESLIQVLEVNTSDIDPYLVHAAARALGSIGDARAVEPLIQALLKPDSRLRWTAASELRSFDDDRAAELLLEALQASDDNVRGMAVELLFEALQASDDNVRGMAADALGRLGDARVVEPLIQALSDSDNYVRSMAAEALGSLGDARAVEPLLEALSDSDQYVRSMAAEALGSLGDARAVEPLLEALLDRHEDVRREAAWSLRQMLDVRGVEPFLRALSDSDPNVGAIAAIALGSLGDTRAVEPLISILLDLTSESRFFVQEEAAWALGSLRDTRAVEPLIHALQDSSSDVRWAATKALSSFRDERAREPLRGALGDKAYVVRLAAAEGLRLLGESWALEPLPVGLGDGASWSGVIGSIDKLWSPASDYLWRLSMHHRLPVRK